MRRFGSPTGRRTETGPGRARRLLAAAAAVTLALALAGMVGIASPPAGALSTASPGGFTGMTPSRILDTREPGQGGCVNGTRSLQVAERADAKGAPYWASAVALNVTVVGPNGPGFVTVWPAGQAQPTASSLNYTAGQVVPNNVIVKVGGLYSISLYANAGCPNLVVDIVGYFTVGNVLPGGLTAVNPQRILDTREPGQGPCVTGVRDLQVAGRAFTDIPSAAASVALNVTVVTPNAGGFLTVYPKGSAPPTASTLNYTGGQIVPNGTVVKVGTDRSISLYANAGCPHVIVDIVGWFMPGTPVAAGGFFGVRPYRLLDSREAGQVPCVNGSRSYRLTVAGIDGSAVPSESRAVALNVTVTGPNGAGFVTVSPTGTPRPTASNLNYVAGQTVPNGVLVKVGSAQQVDVYANNGCPDVIVDLVGGFAGEALDISKPCTPSDLLVAACSTFLQTSLPPAGTDIGEADGAAAYSADGHFAAFTAGSNSQVFWRDLRNGNTLLVSKAPDGTPGDDLSYDPVISADGRYVAFVSEALNLDPNKTTFNAEIYRWDALTRAVTRIEFTIDGSEPNGDAWSPTISDTGSRVAFISDADNLVTYDNYGLAGDAYVIDVPAHTIVVASRTPLTVTTAFGVDSARISGNGRYVAYATLDPLATFDDNDAPDIYRRDLTLNTTDWITRNPAGGATAAGAETPAISRDGNVVAFGSYATEWDSNPADTGSTEDVFTTDVLAGTFTRVSVSPTGGVLDGPSHDPQISADGNVVAYLTEATDAVPGDANGDGTDLVVRNVARATNQMGATAPDGTQLPGTGYCTAPEPPCPFVGATLTADGKYVGFTTAERLTATDTNSNRDAYLRFLAWNPVIAGVSPTSFTGGTTTSVTLTGSGFASDAIVWVDGEGVTVSNVTVNPAGTAITFSLGLAVVTSVGRHDVWVSNPGGATWSSAGGAARGLTGAIRVPA